MSIMSIWDCSKIGNNRWDFLFIIALKQTITFPFGTLNSAALKYFKRITNLDPCASPMYTFTLEVYCMGIQLDHWTKSKSNWQWGSRWNTIKVRSQCINQGLQIYQNGNKFTMISLQILRNILLWKISVYQLLKRSLECALWRILP